MFGTSTEPVKRKNNLKRLRFFLVTGLGCIWLTACGADKEIKEEAEKIVDAVETNDMDTLEQLFFGTDDIAVDEELADFFTSSSTSENDGIIAKIIVQDSIKIKKITDEIIVYEITAPDLSNMLQDAMQEENLTEDSFENYIYSYIEMAEKTKIEVEVPYTCQSDVFIADYTTDEFMNGITGNMMTSYQKLMEEVTSEKGTAE